MGGFLDQDPGERRAPDSARRAARTSQETGDGSDKGSRRGEERPSKRGEERAEPAALLIFKTTEIKPHRASETAF